MGDEVLNLVRGGWLLLGALVGFQPMSGLELPASGRLKSIEVRGGANLALSELEPLLALEIGQPATADRIRRTLLRVRALKLASDAAVYLREEGGETIATVVLWPETRVVRISWEGPWPLPLAVLEERVLQKSGEPLREDRILQSLYALEALLEEQGYLGARVALRVEPIRAGNFGNEVVLVFSFPGAPRWTVGAVELRGVPAVERPELEKRLRLRPGAVYRPSWVAEERDRIRTGLAQRGYRRAEVELEREVRDPEHQRVGLSWQVVPGRKVELEVIGLDPSTVKRRELIALGSGEAVDDSALAETSARLRSYLQQRGYYRAEVVRKHLVTEGTERIRFELQPGVRSVLTEVRLVGAEQVPSQDLLARMQTSPRTPLRPGSGRLVDEELAADLSNLRSYLALEGFLDARVGPARVMEQGRELVLELPIEEGERRRVGRVEMKGVQSLDPKRLEARLAIQSGGPFHRLRLEQAIEEIRAAYEEAGFPAAQVGARTEWVSSSVAKVIFEVLEGWQRRPGRLLLTGLKKTRPEVLRRLLEPELDPPLFEGTRLGLQRALYGLNTFSRVEVRWLEEPSDPQGSDLVAEVEEAETGTVSFGAGYDSESGLRASLRLVESNFRGRLIALRLEVLLAEADQNYRLSLRQPYLGHSRIQLEAILFRERQDRPAFDLVRRGTHLALLRKESSWQATLAHEYRNVRLEEVRGRAEIPRESLTAQVSSLVAGYLLDRRDDPIEPRRGWSLFLQGERAFPLFRAETEFWKAFVQGTALRPVSRGTLAASVRLGSLGNLRPRQPDGSSGLDLVPASERFFAGGRTTHRAYPRDELGLLGATLELDSAGAVVPLGGAATALVNFDFRFPIAGNLGGALFLDGGQVWRSPGDARWPDLRWGAGVGLRYQTPIGPIRLEVGWNLDREPFEDSRVWFLSLGNPF